MVAVREQERAGCSLPHAVHIYIRQLSRDEMTLTWSPVGCGQPTLGPYLVALLNRPLHFNGETTEDPYCNL